MTEQELQAMHDQLVTLENTLTELEDRVSVLETAALPKGEYFEQLVESFHCAPNCCGGGELTLDGSWLLNGNHTLNGVL